MPKKKYSDELKLEIVEKYFKENLSVNELAKRYYISSKADVQKWIAAYEHHGVRRKGSLALLVLTKCYYYDKIYYYN